MQIFKRLKFLIIAIYSYIYQSIHSLFSSQEEDIIVFVVPNKNLICGGTMSISNMADIAKELFPSKKVYLCVNAKYQKFLRYSGFNSPHRILNIRNYIDKWLKRSNVIINVYESGTIELLNYLNQPKFKNKLDSIQVNILNQNQEMMPSEEDVYRSLGKIKKLTMTLAYKSNSRLEYPYLVIPPRHVGAWFPETRNEIPPFEEKRDFCIISPDKNEFKSEIVQLLTSNGIECFDEWPIPYALFNKLQKQAKWTISFGEGWDGYTMGQFLNGGIGFGVYNKNFEQNYFDTKSLPPFLFKSYEDMRANIIRIINEYNNKITFESTVAEMTTIMASDPDSNTADKVKNRWKSFYENDILIYPKQV